ncbi:MAG: hypothetical protein NTU47_16490 [Ignavibacteriales bacterium]|nr:hypothetical protein [Ignavibacteriales bacterium]
MSNNADEKHATGTPRRVFFGQMLTAVGGGILGGSLLQKLFGSRTRDRENDRPVNISINPLAVPRSKEGSTSNV